MRVKEVMTKGVECVHPDSTLQEAARKMKALDVGPLPVCEDDRLVGMLTDRDITVRAVAAGNDPIMGRVRDAMTPDVAVCYEDHDVAEVARLMEERKIRRIVVLNRDKRMVGIVSLGDLAVRISGEQPASEVLEKVSTPGAPR